MTSKPPKLIRSDLESNLQSTILKWLKSKGCFACKMQQNATTKVGVADVFFCHKGFYGFLEIKQHKDSPRRPGQEAFIRKMDKWSFGRLVYKENWTEVKKELEDLLK